MSHRTVLPARASIAPFPPQLIINVKRKGLYDIMDGAAKEFYNELAETLRLNITIVEATSPGFCYVNETSSYHCTGIRHQLANNLSDLSLFNDQLDMFDHRLPEVPLTIGPTAAEADQRFSSFPEVEAHQMFGSFMDTFHELSLSLVGLSTLLYLISCICTNWSFAKKRFCCRMDFFSVLSMTISRPYTQFRRTRQRLAYISCLLMAFHFYIFFTSNIKSEMVTMIPAKYLETFEEVLQSNRTPIFIEGFSLYNSFKESSDLVRQQLLKKSLSMNGTKKSSDSGTVPDVAQLELKSRGIGFHEDSYMARAVAALVCIQSEYDIETISRLKFSEPFGRTTWISVFRKDIWKDNPILARRLHDVWTWYLEGGLWERHHHNLAQELQNTGIADIPKLILCLDQLHKIEKQLPKVEPLSLTNFLPFYRLIVISQILLIMILLMETLSYNSIISL